MSKKPAPPASYPVAMVRVNHFMPPEMAQGLKDVAKARGGTASDHLRKAVSAYLKRYGPAV